MQVWPEVSSWITGPDLSHGWYWYTTVAPCYVGQDLVKLVIVNITQLTHSSSSSSVAAQSGSLILVSSSVSSFMVSTFIERNLMEAKTGKTICDLTKGRL